MTKSKWFVPLFAVALGMIMLAAQWIGGHAESGLGSLGIMAAFAALVLLGGRSETIRGLRGDGRDERFRQIVAFIVELARGHSGNPYGWLGAIVGLAYLGAIVVLRIRGENPPSSAGAWRKLLVSLVARSPSGCSMVRPGSTGSSLLTPLRREAEGWRDDFVHAGLPRTSRAAARQMWSEAK